MGVEPALVRHRFTRLEFDRLVEGGALAPDLRVELLDGEIVDVSPQGPRHAAGIQELTRWFAPRAELLRIQLPLAAGEYSEVEPDVALAEHADSSSHPESALLVVEVVISERQAALHKVAIYALAGVPEYWIVDVPRREVLVHREPAGDRYATSKRCSGDLELHPPAGLPPRTVADLFAAARL